jgi:hypothetical protein
MTKAEKAVVEAAMKCVDREPVNSMAVGYMLEWKRLVKACAALQKKTKGKK